MNIAIVDDLQEEREKTQSIISEYAALNHINLSVSEYTNAEDFLADYQPLSYSAVFLDIFMDGMTGIEAAKKIRETDKDIIIVFLTTSEDFMPDAFRLHAYEYILKPFKKEDVFPMMDDILRRTTPVTSPSFSFQSREGEASVFFDDLVMIETDTHNYLEVLDKDGQEYLTRMTIAEAGEHLLEDTRFITARRGVIVNMAYIQRFDDDALHLTVGKPIPISPRNRKKLEQIWDNYLLDNMRRDNQRGGGL